MITAVEGEMTSAGVGWVEVRVGGVSLKVFVPPAAVEELGPLGGPVRLETSLQFSQDAMTLYGFPNKDARSAFEALIEVSGVGPRLALSVLSSLTPEALAVAVASGDQDTFKGIAGVGQKTAARILLDLKGKLQAEFAVVPGSTLDTEVVDALTAIGYTVPEARDGVSSAAPDKSLPLEERVRLVLQSMGAG